MGRRDELVHKLVTTFHLSVSERQELYPSYVLTDEVKTVIRAELSQYGWYPRNWRPHTPGNVVCEGHGIEASEAGVFRVHAQAGFPIDPNRLRASRTREFASEDEAVDFFLEGEFPSGKIDGISIVSRSSQQS